MTADARGKPGHIFTNWATTYSCQPELYFEPETTEEIRQVLTFAREKGKKVKVIGNGYSPSDLCCTTDYMISLRRYGKLLHVDEDLQQVTVQGGCLVRDLNQNLLPTHGLALSVQSVVPDVTVAGAISTGSHGTGADFGTMSFYVVAVDLMIASGEVIHISKEENSELLPAASLSLGALGVILTVTLQCEPAFNLHVKQSPVSLKGVLENVKTYVKSSDHFDFFYFPYVEDVVCFQSSRSKQERSVQSGSWFWGRLVGFHLLQLLLWLSTFIPRLVPVINRFYFRVLFGHPGERIDESHKVFNFDCWFSQYVMDWAIPRESVGEVLTQLNTWIVNNRFPAHFPVDVRFVKGDNIYLSPAYGRDTCYINLIMFRPYNKDVSTKDYWDAFERIVASVGGRPHWAKDHNYGGKDFEALYPKWGEFCRLREQLDPNGMFLNAYLERVFGKTSGRSKTSTV